MPDAGHDPDPRDDESLDAFEALVIEAVDEVLASEDPARFFTWVRDAHERFGEEGLDPARRMARAMALGRAIWNATPLPSNGMRPRTLAAPKRNEACVCGSEKKFKKCCGAHGEDSGVPLLDAEGIEAIAYERLSEEQRAKVRGLDNGGSDKQCTMLAIAELEGGKFEAARELLEPVFERGLASGSTHPLYATVFAALIRAYAHLEQEAEIDDVTRRAAGLGRSSPMRASARVQLAEICVLDGQPERALEWIEAAKRDDYGASDLPRNEVITLRALGREDEATACAERWIDELIEDEGFDNREEIEVLEQLLEEIAREAELDDDVDDDTGHEDEGDSEHGQPKATPSEEVARGQAQRAASGLHLVEPDDGEGSEAEPGDDAANSDDA